MPVKQRALNDKQRQERRQVLLHAGCAVFSGSLLAG
jgi:hypothetical protein